jgi:hypothetical protein
MDALHLSRPVARSKRDVVIPRDDTSFTWPSPLACQSCQSSSLYRFRSVVGWEELYYLALFSLCSGTLSQTLTLANANIGLSLQPSNPPHKDPVSRHPRLSVYTYSFLRGTSPE